MNPEADDDDVAAAVSTYNDPKRSMAERVGLRNYAQPVSDDMSKEEADQYLAEHRARSSGSTTPPDLSKADADKYLQQYRAQRGVTPTPATFNERFAGDAPAAAAPITGEQAVAPPENPFSAAFHAMPPIVQEHPYIAAAGGLAGGALAGAALPEGALASLIAGTGRHVIAPVARWGLGLAGLDWLSGGRAHERLIDLLTRGLDEGGGASAP